MLLVDPVGFTPVFCAWDFWVKLFIFSSVQNIDPWQQDYLDTIRKQDQQIKLIEVILDKIHPTVRKDCNYRYIE